MAPKKRYVPPIRPNADGTGFKKVDASSASRPSPPVVEAEAPAPAPTRGRPGSNLQDMREKRADPSVTRPLPVPSLAPSSKPIPPARQERESRRKESPLAAPRPAEKTATNAVVKVLDAPSIQANECRVHPSTCPALRLRSGSLVRLHSSTSDVSVFVEVLLSVTVKNNTVVLCPETLHLLDDTEVEMEVVNSATAPVPMLGGVWLSVRVDAAKTADLVTPSQASLLEWQSLFRAHFQHRLVFAGMICRLRWCSYIVVLTVEKLSSTDDDPSSGMCNAPCGILTDGTCFSFGGADGAFSSSYPVAEERPLPASVKPPHTLVLGESGVGKSFYMKKDAASEAGTRQILHLRVEELPQSTESEVSSATVLREVFAKARDCAPSTIYLDNLHLLCNTKHTTSVGSSWAVALFATAFADGMREMEERGANVRVVASAPHMDALDPSLVSKSLLGQHVVTLFPPSTAAEREEVFIECLAQVGVKAPTTTALAPAVAEVAAHGHGFTQRDLFRLAEASAIEAVHRDGTVESLTVEDIRHARRSIRPSSLQQFDVAIPEVTWADIGGSEEAKRTLQEVVEWCLGKQSWLFQEFRLTPPKGVLLYGPPGCSKTMLAKALANESRMNFISVKGPEVFSKWVGDSEKAVRDIFARARAVAPCVVFIDELDGMCGHRGSGGVSDRVISQFLTELDGLPAAFAEKSNALIFVAATNRPDNIDGAVLRPGRIDRCVHVGLPTLKEREAIVAIQFRRIPTEDALTASFVAERTEGYTGAEVVAVVKEAAFTAISENTVAEQLLTSHVLVALQKIKPRISASDVLWYKQWAMRGMHS